MDACLIKMIIGTYLIGEPWTYSTATLILMGPFVQPPYHDVRCSVCAWSMSVALGPHPNFLRLKSYSSAAI